MAKVSAPIQEVSRLLDLVPYLSTHSYISLKDLALDFGVTEKEIAKQLTALSMCGENKFELIDVTFDSGFVTIRDHERLDIPRALTGLEVASLLIGLELMRDGAGDEHAEILSKIDSLISKLSSLAGEVIEIGTHPEAHHIAKIERAIGERSLLTITYESSLNGQSHDRLIEPLSIYLEKSHTYLNAYCHKAKAYRNFRLDRVLTIENSSATPASDRRSENSGEKERFTIEVLRRKRAISEFLQIEQLPATGVVEVEAFSPVWVGKAVTSFAPDMTLKSPLENRSEIRAAMEKILSLYRS
jgi:proteasome accessory factor C